MWNVVLGCNLENNRIISVPSQGKPFNIPVIQVYAPATDVKEAEVGLGVQNEAGQRLTEFCQENMLVIVNTVFKQHTGRLYTWTSPDGQYQNQTDFVLCSQRWRSSIQWVKTILEPNCGSDHELLNAKFRLKLKKVGESTRSFRYDLKIVMNNSRD